MWALVIFRVRVQVVNSLWCVLSISHSLSTLNFLSMSASGRFCLPICTRMVGSLTVVAWHPLKPSPTWIHKQIHLQSYIVLAPTNCTPFMDDWLFGVCSLLGTPPSVAAMPREDKPSCGVSWWRGSACCGGGGFLIRELWRWQGPSLLSVQPSRETFSVGFNSRLTSLSASGVRRQTCKDLVQKQRVWSKSLSHYKAAETIPHGILST